MTQATPLRMADPVVKSIFTQIEAMAGPWAAEHPQAMAAERGEGLGGTGNLWENVDFHGCPMGFQWKN